MTLSSSSHQSWVAAQGVWINQQLFHHGLPWCWLSRSKTFHALRYSCLIGIARIPHGFRVFLHSASRHGRGSSCGRWGVSKRRQLRHQGIEALGSFTFHSQAEAWQSASSCKVALRLNKACGMFLACSSKRKRKLQVDLNTQLAAVNRLLACGAVRSSP